MSKKVLTLKKQSVILLMHFKKKELKSLRKCSLKTEQNVTLSS